MGSNTRSASKKANIFDDMNKVQAQAEIEKMQAVPLNASIIKQALQKRNVQIGSAQRFDTLAKQLLASFHEVLYCYHL